MFQLVKSDKAYSIHAPQLLCFLAHSLRLSMAPDIGKECCIQFVSSAAIRLKGYAFEMGRFRLGDLSLRKIRQRQGAAHVTNIFFPKRFGK